jgi:hypothetical protein
MQEATHKFEDCTYYSWLHLAKENLKLISFLETQPCSGTEALGFA